MWKDWCPLCGSRFEAETAEELEEKILKHMEPGEDGKSYCEEHFRPLNVVLADDHY